MKLISSIKPLSIATAVLVLAACFPIDIAAAEIPAAPPKDARRLLQEGLFEEEASRDLDKAAAAYAAVIAQIDAQRTLGATAIFRLAEVRAKQGKKEEAAALYQRIIAEFPNQDALVKLSRERLGTPGTEVPAAASDLASDEEARELARLRVIAKDSPDLLFAREALSKTLLESAASKGWVKVIEFLFSQGAKDPNRDASGENSALVWAAAAGHRAAVEALIAHGSDINALGRYADKFGKQDGVHTPLTIAIKLGRKAVISVLLERGADVNKADASAHTPLTLAAGQEDMDLCKALLAKGADPNLARPVIAPDFRGEQPKGKQPAFTPLAATQNVEILKLLLAHGAKPLLPQPARYTEVEWFIGNWNKPALELLLPLLPKLTDPDTLRQAVFAHPQNKDILPLILKHHGNVNVKMEAGQPPLLIHAMQNGGQGNAQWMEAMKILLDAGVLPNGVDDQGKTPLHWLADLPLQPPAPQPVAGIPGLEPTRAVPRMPARPMAFPFAREPEHAAALQEEMNEKWRAHLPLFDALVAKGADINARDAHGDTPLILFMLRNSYATEGVAWFVAEGGNILAKGQLQLGAPMESALGAGALELRPEYARKYLFPKLARPDAVLVWGWEELDKPVEIKRTPEGAAPQFDDVAKVTPFAEDFPVLVAVINRKGADGNWREVETVRVPLETGAPVPKLEWGDAVFFSAHSELLRQERSN